MRSKRVLRQLKKSFGSEDFPERLALQDSEAVAKVTSGLSDFIDRVEEAYREDVRLLEVSQRNMRISTDELSSTNVRLSKLNRTVTAMLDSLGQGLLLFDRTGHCLDVYSKACVDLLKTSPSGKHIADILRVPATKRQSFVDWYILMFDERLDFADLAAVGPQTFEFGNPRFISLEFKPVRGTLGPIDFILMIATDRTQEIEAKERAAETAAFSNVVLSLVKDRNQFQTFVQDAKHLLDDTAQIVRASNLSAMDQACRNLHTLKAIASSISATRIGFSIQEFEMCTVDEHNQHKKLELLSQLMPRIEAEYDDYMGLIRDLMGSVSVDKVREHSRARLLQFKLLIESSNVSREQLLHAFRENILCTPIKEIFEAFDEVIAQTALRLKKRISQILITGDAVSIEREMHAPLWASLHNVFRNIVDHGIESPQSRLRKGKSETGNVRVTVLCTPDRWLEIKISDDGAGVDVEALKWNLTQSGRADFVEKASQAEIIETIFERGMSTATWVTDISGMGLGLSSVKEAVLRCGGTIKVESQLGQGTSFHLRLPLL